MRGLALASVVALSFMLNAGAAATCTPTTSASRVCFDSICHPVGIDSTFYVVVWYSPIEGQIDWVVYTEGNGISGLQRSDPMRDDTCNGMIEPDTLVV